MEVKRREFPEAKKVSGEVFLPLRAENADFAKLMEIGGKEILLASQLKIVKLIKDYVFTEESGPFNYSFYLTGQKGVGKTLTVLLAMAEALSQNSSLTISFMTFGVDGKIVKYPEFEADPKRADIVVLNDLHYHLEAILAGKIDRTAALDKLIETFSLIESNNFKAIVVSDQPLIYYADKLCDERFTKAVKGTYLLENHELMTGRYDDLKDISVRLGLGLSEDLIIGISETNRNIRFMSKLRSIYGEKVRSIKSLADGMKEVEQSAPIKAILEHPTITNIDELLDICGAANWNFRTKDQVNKINEAKNKYFELDEQNNFLTQRAEKLEARHEELMTKARRLVPSYSNNDDYILAELGKKIRKGELAPEDQEHARRIIKEEKVISKSREPIREENYQIVREMNRNEAKILDGVERVFELLDKATLSKTYIRTDIFDADRKNRSARLLVRADFSRHSFEIKPRLVLGGSFIQSVMLGQAAKNVEFRIPRTSL